VEERKKPSLPGRALRMMALDSQGYSSIAPVS